MKKKQEVKQWKKREPGAMYDTRQRREEPLNSALLHGLSPTQDSAVFNVKFIIVSVILEATGKTSSFPQTTPRCCPALSPRGGRDHSGGTTDGCRPGDSQQRKSSSFQLMSTFTAQFRVP